MPRGTTPDAGTLQASEYPYPTKLHYLELAGTLDKTNRYSAAVEIATSAPTEAGLKGLCNGVLVSPRHVLTGGHCVCARRLDSTAGREGKFVINRASCSENPIVTTMVYPPPEGDVSAAGTGSQLYKGQKVWPHPDFEILIDASGRVESSQADLALILLESPVAEKFSPPPFAEEDVHEGETIVMVGGTFDELLGGISRQRRFIRYKVVSFLDSERGWVLYDQPQRQLYRGSSGGPCMREAPGGPVLVGISGRGLGEAPTFTSIRPYLDWLRSSLRSAQFK